MIKIIDYGMGNLRSVEKAFEFIGCEVELTSSKEEIVTADGLVLPGVGAFKSGMKNLQERGLIDAIYEAVEKGTPLLGICLGLHLLFSDSEEFGYSKGLGIIKGSVKRFPSDIGIKIPHIGWNQLELKKETPLYEGIGDGDFQYFVHSYYVEPSNLEVIATRTSYGIDFVSSIAYKNIYGVQFHPEKSSEKGLVVLKNFGELVANFK